MGNRIISKEETDSLSEYTKEQIATHWTVDYTIKPALLNTVYGDGKMLIFLYPMDDRPNHYLILVDSKTNTSGDEWYDLLEDEIYEAIKDQFGYKGWNEDGDDEKFPVFDYGCGFSWGEKLLKQEKQDQ